MITVEQTVTHYSTGEVTTLSAKYQTLNWSEIIALCICSVDIDSLFSPTPPTVLTENSYLFVTVRSRTGFRFEICYLGCNVIYNVEVIRILAANH